MDALRERWDKLMKNVPKSEWTTPENMAKWQKMYTERRESPKHKQLMAESQRLEKDMQKFVDAREARQGSADVPHGYVWLFRRK